MIKQGLFIKEALDLQFRYNSADTVHDMAQDMTLLNFIKQTDFE